MAQNTPQRRSSPFYLLQDLFADDFLPPANFSKGDGLTLSEDDNNIYVEAALPGLKPEDIEVTFDKGTLWIRGEKEEEESDKKKKFYRKASSSFSYQCVLPADTDESHHPEATFSDGVMKVTFAKRSKEEPRRIQVKKG